MTLPVTNSYRTALQALQGVQPAVQAVFLTHQCIMRAVFHHAPMLEHHNTVQPPHGRQTMRHHQHRAPLHQPLHGLLHQSLGLRIQTGRCLIHDQNRRIGQKSTGNGHTLALPAGQLDATLPHKGFIPIGQTVDKAGGIGQPRGLLYLRPRGTGAPIRNVFRQTAVEQHGSCGTSAIRARKADWRTVAISVPSTRITPACGA